MPAHNFRSHPHPLPGAQRLWGRTGSQERRRRRWALRKALRSHAQIQTTAPSQDIADAEAAIAAVLGVSGVTQAACMSSYTVLYGGGQEARTAVEMVRQMIEELSHDGAVPSRLSFRTARMGIFAYNSAQWTAVVLGTPDMDRAAIDTAFAVFGGHTCAEQATPEYETATAGGAHVSAAEQGGE